MSDVQHIPRLVRLRRRIGRYGIRIFGVDYNSNALTWVRARVVRHAAVEVTIDPQDRSWISVRDPYVYTWIRVPSVHYPSGLLQRTAATSDPRCDPTF